MVRFLFKWNHKIVGFRIGDTAFHVDWNPLQQFCYDSWDLDGWRNRGLYLYFFSLHLDTRLR